MSAGKKRFDTWALAAAALVSLAALALEPRLTPYRRSPSYATMTRAARIMEESTRLAREARLEAGVPVDRAVDLNGTGLIGVEYSGTTTSLGDLAAKRTVASPDMAAAMVGLLVEAGVKPGDTVAVGASGSFPGAVLATLAAARAMDLQVALIPSLGSSTWGANVPGFSILAIVKASEATHGYRAVAASLGGTGDAGLEMDPEALDALRDELSSSGVVVIESRDVADGIRQRMTLYDNFAAGRPIAAFVNIGGASASIGEGAGSLELVPGVNATVARLSGASDARGDDGVVFEMGARGIPVIHVLNIRKLSTDRGFPWDPVPFPPVGASRVYLVRDEAAYRRSLVALSAAYALALGGIAFLAVRLRRKP